MESEESEQEVPKTRTAARTTGQSIRLLKGLELIFIVGGRAPRVALAAKAARKSAPIYDPDEDEGDEDEEVKPDKSEEEEVPAPKSRTKTTSRKSSEFCIS